MHRKWLYAYLLIGKVEHIGLCVPEGTYVLSLFFSSLFLSREPGICWLSSAFLPQHWHSCPLSQDEPGFHSWVYITSPLCSPLAPSGRSMDWHRFYTWRNCWRQLRILLDLSLCLWAALFPHSIAQWSNIRQCMEVYPWKAGRPTFRSIL